MIKSRDPSAMTDAECQQELAQILADMDVSVNRFEERRESLRARLAVRG